MAIHLLDMKVTHIADKCHYEIEYQGNVFILQRPLFHSIYDKKDNVQSHRILKEMFKDDLFLKGYRSEPNFVKEEEPFWFGLINHDLKKQIPPPPKPPKPPEPPKTRVVGGRPPRFGGLMFE